MIPDIVEAILVGEEPSWAIAYDAYEGVARAVGRAARHPWIRVLWLCWNNTLISGQENGLRSSH